jgi:L-ascorbate metabolism protein UlaG (beta-lactamase superfamily)
MKFGDVDLKWLGHVGFLISNSKVIYIDPYKIKDDLPKADLVLITHSHYDHCSFEDLKKIVTPTTKIVITADSQSKIARFDFPVRMIVIEPNEEIEVSGIKVTALPSYNVDKDFHSKEEGWVGYLLRIDDTLIYHAGDTDLIPEMQKLTGYNQRGKQLIALLPVGGRFTMNAEEAYEAAKVIKPTIAIPMHWGSIIGSIEDAEEFKELCEEDNIKVEILDKE